MGILYLPKFIDDRDCVKTEGRTNETSELQTRVNPIFLCCGHGYAPFLCSGYGYAPFAQMNMT